MPGYEHYSHEELAAAVADADPEGLLALAERLVALAPKLNETGVWIAARMSAVAWQGETADVFRAWGDHFRRESSTLGDYVDAMGTMMGQVGQALWEARETMPPPPPVVQMRDPLADTALADLDRQEAIGVLQRLDSHYRVAAESLRAATEPQFKLMDVNLQGVESFLPPSSPAPYGGSGYDDGGYGAVPNGTSGFGPVATERDPGPGRVPGANTGYPPPYVPGTTDPAPALPYPPLGDDRTGTSLDSVGGGDGNTGLLTPPQSAGDRAPVPPQGRSAVPEPYAPFPGPRVPAQFGRFGPQTPGGPAGAPPRDFPPGQAARNTVSPPPRTVGDPGTHHQAPVGRPTAPGYGGGQRGGLPSGRNGIVGGIPRPSERLTKGIPRGGAIGTGTVPAYRDPATGAVRGPGGGLVGRSPVIGATGNRADGPRTDGVRNGRTSGATTPDATPGRLAARDAGAGRAGGVTGRARQPKRRRRSRWESTPQRDGQRERDNPS